MGYRLSALAIADAWANIAAEANESSADRFVDTLFEKFALLSAFPASVAPGRSSASGAAPCR